MLDITCSRSLIVLFYRSCRTGCRPAVCDGPSGRDDSFGRRKKRDGDSVWTYEDNAYNSRYGKTENGHRCVDVLYLLGNLNITKNML